MPKSDASSASNPHVQAQRDLSIISISPPVIRWRGGAAGRALDLLLIGRGFKSCSGQRCVTTLGKLFTPMCLCHQAV